MLLIHASNNFAGIKSSQITNKFLSFTAAMTKCQNSEIMND